MKVLVTGALGFVGRWVCADLLANGHTVVGATRVASERKGLSGEWRATLKDVTWAALDLNDDASIGKALDLGPDAVVHLAAMASGARARSAPLDAWTTNCLGTCRLAYQIRERRPSTRVVFASTGEVYGAALTRPATEDMPVQPSSPYAASKAAAELALLELHRRFGADVVVARAFQQTGPGQSLDFVIPALARRILEARRQGKHQVPAGNLSPTREFIDVRDAAVALRVLLERGQAGGVYNIAVGKGLELSEVFRLLTKAAQWDCEVVADPGLLRAGDIKYLVGDGARIAALGWKPRFALTDTLRDVIESLGDANETPQH